MRGFFGEGGMPPGISGEPGVDEARDRAARESSDVADSDAEDAERKEARESRPRRAAFTGHLRAALAVLTLASAGAAEAQPGKGRGHKEPDRSAEASKRPEPTRDAVLKIVALDAESGLADRQAGAAVAADVRQGLDEALAEAAPSGQKALLQETANRVAFYQAARRPAAEPRRAEPPAPAENAPEKERTERAISALTVQLDAARIASLFTRDKAPVTKQGARAAATEVADDVFAARFMMAEKKASMAGSAEDAATMTLTPEDVEVYGSRTPFLQTQPELVRLEGGAIQAGSDYRVTTALHQVLADDLASAAETLRGHEGERLFVMQTLGHELTKRYDMARAAASEEEAERPVTTEELRANLARAERIAGPLKVVMGEFGGLNQRYRENKRTVEAGDSAGFSQEAKDEAARRLEIDRGKAENLLKALASASGKSVDDLLGGKTLEQFVSSYDSQAGARLAKSLELRKGICRDMGAYLAKVSADLGIAETFSSTVSWNGGPHLINGGRAKDGFYFQNYGQLYFSGSGEFRDALEEYNQNEMHAPMLRHFVSRGEDEGQRVVPVTTRSGEQLTRVARGDRRGLGDETADAARRETFTSPGGLRLSLGRTEMGVGASRELVDFDLGPVELRGSTAVSFERLDNSLDTHNMIKDAWAGRVGQSLSARLWDQELSFTGGLAYAAGEIKANDAAGEPIKMKQMMYQLSPRLTGGADVSDSLRYSYALAFETLIATDMQFEHASKSGGQSGATDQRLTYVGADLETFVGVRAEASRVPNDLRGVNMGGLYADLMAVQGGASFSGRRLTVAGEALYGVKGTDRDADVLQGRLKALVDQQYFLNLEGRMVAPRTFLVNPELKVRAELGVVAGPVVATIYGTREKESDDPKNPAVLAAGVDLKIVIP